MDLELQSQMIDFGVRSSECGGVRALSCLFQGDSPTGEPELLDGIRKIFVLSQPVRDQFPEDWRPIADAWMLTLAVVAVCCAALLIAIKWYLKVKPGRQINRTWSKPETLGFMTIGLFPVLSVLAIVWLAQNEYRTIVEIAGLFTGVFVSWVLYLFFLVIAHAVAWREDMSF
jgi:hypothetical protein